MIRKLLKIIFLYIAPVVFAVAALAVFGAMSVYSKPGPLAKDTLVMIEPGKGTRQIAEILLYNGIFDIQGEYIFLAAAKINKMNLKAGEFEFKAQTSIKDALALLNSGKTHLRRMTVPEGLMSFEIVDIVSKADALEGAVAEIPPEGSLLPETYTYSRGDSRESIIDHMEKSMQDTVRDLWEKRAADLPVKTPEEAVTLASIVEKETGVSAERARVAGVFVNRLKTGMPLQSDPTVIYAVTEGKAKLDRPIYRKDLDRASPYNTYLNTGLPPGPIANPGRASIEAVLHPETHDFVYFVADGTGGHAFAKTLNEHLKNVAYWRSLQKGN